MSRVLRADCACWTATASVNAIAKAIGLCIGLSSFFTALSSSSAFLPVPSIQPIPPVSTCNLACDERLDHLTSLVGLWSRLRDPFVLAVFENVELHVAAGGAVGLHELFLDGRPHVVVERA